MGVVVVGPMEQMWSLEKMNVSVLVWEECWVLVARREKGFVGWLKKEDGPMREKRELSEKKV